MRLFGSFNRRIIEVRIDHQVLYDVQLIIQVVFLLDYAGEVFYGQLVRSRVVSEDIHSAVGILVTGAFAVDDFHRRGFACAVWA